VRAELLADHPLDVTDISFSNDGARLMSMNGIQLVDRRRHAEVIVWDVARAQQLHTLRFRFTYSCHAAISNQGVVVMSIREENELRVYRCGTPEERVETLLAVQCPSRLSFAGDGDFLYFHA